MFVRSLFLAAVAALTISAPLVTQAAPTFSLTAVTSPGGSLLPSAGVNTFTGQAGVNPDGSALWGVLVMYDLEGCATAGDCPNVNLAIGDGSSTPFKVIDLFAKFGDATPALGAFFNMVDELDPSVFDPLGDSAFEFILSTADIGGTPVTEATIYVEVAAANGNVPEPGTLALVGLALAGAGVVRRYGRRAN